MNTKILAYFQICISVPLKSTRGPAAATAFEWILQGPIQTANWMQCSSEFTLSLRRSLSYRNQSIDLLCKSMDLFLYNRDLRHKWVKCELSCLNHFLPRVSLLINIRKEIFWCFWGYFWGCFFHDLCSLKSGELPSSVSTKMSDKLIQL